MRNQEGTNQVKLASQQTNNWLISQRHVILMRLLRINSNHGFVLTNGCMVIVQPFLCA